MRRDLQPLRPEDELTAELKLLTARRADLVADRTRLINRLRGLLTSIFPALERALDLTAAGPLVLLGGYQTPRRSPAAIRAAGPQALEAWLRERKVRNAGKIAGAAAAAAVRHQAGPHHANPRVIAHVFLSSLQLRRPVLRLRCLRRCGGTGRRPRRTPR